MKARREGWFRIGRLDRKMCRLAVKAGDEKIYLAFINNLAKGSLTPVKQKLIIILWFHRSRGCDVTTIESTRPTKRISRHRGRGHRRRGSRLWPRPDLSAAGPDRGTIAPADRYVSPQVGEGDVTLGDTSIPKLMQTDAFEVMSKNPNFRTLASDPGFAALAAEQPGDGGDRRQSAGVYRAGRRIRRHSRRH